MGTLNEQSRVTYHNYFYFTGKFWKISHDENRSSELKIAYYIPAGVLHGVRVLPRPHSPVVVVELLGCFVLSGRQVGVG